MTEYDYSPAAFEAYERKQRSVRKWSQDVSKHEPVNPFVASSDRESSDFYGKHDKDDADRPPTPPRSGSLDYVYGSAPYGAYPSFTQQQQQRQHGWPTNIAYPSPPVPQYAPQAQHPPATFLNKSTGQPYANAFNPQTQLWEHHDTNRHSSKKKHRNPKRRGTAPAGLSLGQAISPGSGGWTIYPGGPQPMQSPGLSSAGSYPYSTTQPPQSMSTMYLPSGHTSPTPMQYPVPQSAPVTQATAFQAQQQQAPRAISPPVIPLTTGVATSYTGYPSARSTPAPTGYFPAAPPQPLATVVLESKRKSSKDSGASSFFGRLTGKKKR